MGFGVFGGDIEIETEGIRGIDEAKSLEIREHRDRNLKSCWRIFVRIKTNRSSGSLLNWSFASDSDLFMLISTVRWRWKMADGDWWYASTFVVFVKSWPALFGVYNGVDVVFCNTSICIRLKWVTFFTFGTIHTTILHRIFNLTINFTIFWSPLF